MAFEPCDAPQPHTVAEHFFIRLPFKRELRSRFPHRFHHSSGHLLASRRRRAPQHISGHIVQSTHNPLLISQSVSLREMMHGVAQAGGE